MFVINIAVRWKQPFLNSGSSGVDDDKDGNYSKRCLWVSPKLPVIAAAGRCNRCCVSSP